MHIEKKTLKYIFLGVGACILLYWLLHGKEGVNAFFTTISGIVSPFLVGACLAFIVNVPMRAVENKMSKIKGEKVRRVLALVITLFFVAIVLALVLGLLIPQLVETVGDLIPKLTYFATEVENKSKSLFNDHPKIKEWIEKNGILDVAINYLGSLLSELLTKTVGAISNIASAVMNAVISLVFAVYCLCQKETLSRQGRKILYAFLPEKPADNIIRTLRLTNSTFSNFLSGQCIEVCILGCMFAVAMAIFRMPYIPLVSVLIAITAFIPVVGSWVGCACGAFLILVEDPILAAGFVVMFIILQQIENNVIYPRVVGTTIGLSGMWVLVAVAIGGELFGVAGMFLMIPVAAVIQILLREATAKKLQEKAIDPEKLVPQPPMPNTRMNVNVKQEKKNKRNKKVKCETEE